LSWCIVTYPEAISLRKMSSPRTIVYCVIAYVAIWLKTETPAVDRPKQSNSCFGNFAVFDLKRRLPTVADISIVFPTRVFTNPKHVFFSTTRNPFFSTSKPGYLENPGMLLHSNIGDSDNTEVADWGVPNQHVWTFNYYHEARGACFARLPSIRSLLVRLYFRSIDLFRRIV